MLILTMTRVRCESYTVIHNNMYLSNTAIVPI